MTDKTHTYDVTITWTDDTGKGTRSPGSYSRNHTVAVGEKPPIEASSDPAFRGDPTRYNPEELLVAALSECHMLWFLGLCARNRIVVTSYIDHAVGTMRENPDGSGEFTLVTLRPEITLANPDAQEDADALHEGAHHMCFISRSVNFPVEIEATYR